MRVGRDVPKDDPKHGTFLYGSNQWPDLPERDFKEPVMEYREHMLRLATDIMVILSKGLQYGDDAFDEYLQDPVASVKLLHYPPQPVDGGNEIGAGAHTDFGSITILMQHPGQEGLEVLHPTTDSWIPVPTVEDTFVINVGDVLSAWTSGQYRSALHRVINTSRTDRYSVPFFLDGNMSAEMAPLDGSGKAGTGKTVGQHYQQMFSSTYIK